jgi:arylsulfatase A-like enzyme
VKPGISDALICHIDFLASFAALTRQSLGAGEGPDSIDTLATFLGDSKTERSQLVEHAAALGLRKGQQKYIEPKSGPKFLPATRTETGNDPNGLLFELGSDLGETDNLATRKPDLMKELHQELEKIRNSAP